MLTERAKRRIDSQQLCNFTALDKQTKHELMVNKRRRMLQSRQMVGGAVAACQELGCSQGLPALHAHAHVVRGMWGRRTWRKGGSPHSRRPVYANPCPHQAATHTRHGVRGSQRRGHGRRRVQIVGATGPPYAARADLVPGAEVTRYSTQYSFAHIWVVIIWAVRG